MLFLPEKFQIRLNELNEDLTHPIDANSIKNIQKFLNYFSTLTNIENPNFFFKIIFKKNISEINYNFLKRVNRDLSGSMSSCISTLLTTRTL